MQFSTPLLVSLTLSSLVGCTDDGPAVEPSLLRYEGIYEVLQHTENTSACSQQGAVAFADTEKFVVATVEHIFGTPFLNIASCASPAACRDLAAKLARDEFVTYEFGYALERPDGETDLVGGGASTGFLDGNVCKEGSVHETRLFGPADQPSAWRIDKRITIADDYPADGQTCWTDAAKTAARGNECSQLEHLSVRLVERL
jgi:hypothetical protein